jgi:hypothetical protein
VECIDKKEQAMTEMLHKYDTDDGLKLLCEDCVHERRQTGQRCEWAETPVHREQARLSCQDCGATVEDEELPQPEPPGPDALMRWEAEGFCEAACPHGCLVEPDGTCPHGHPSWLLVMGLI